jgi:hypothetical protein
MAVNGYLKMKKLLALMIVLLTAGCGTPYQSAGGLSMTGGFYESPGAGKMEKIEFSGNGFITPKTVEQYTLYRCAEVAKSKNKSHFIIYGSLIDAAQKYYAESPTVGMVGGKPTGFAFVLFLDAPEVGSKETEKVLSELESVVKQKPAAAKS